MAVTTVNEPVFCWTCDLCGKQEEGRWEPSNWASMRIDMHHKVELVNICQDCLTNETIIKLTNKITAQL